MLKHADKHKEGLPRVKNESLDSNNFCLICAGVSNVGGYNFIFFNARYNLICKPLVLQQYSHHILLACKLQVFESK